MNPNLKTYDLVLAADPHDAEEHHRITGLPRDQVLTFDGVKWGAMRGHKPRRMYWTQRFQEAFLNAEFWEAQAVREAVYWRALAMKEQRDDAVVVPFATWYEYEETPLEREPGKWGWRRAYTREQLDKVTDAEAMFMGDLNRGKRALCDDAHDAGVDVYPPRIVATSQRDPGQDIVLLELSWTPLPARGRGLKTTLDYQRRMGIPGFEFREVAPWRQVENRRNGPRLDQW